jgi:putative hydrolase of the HAD superfamily
VYTIPESCRNISVQCYNLLIITTIIFDFGGVILTHDAKVSERILAAMFPNHIEQAAQIWAEYKELLNTGKKTSEDFLQAVKSETNLNTPVEALKRRWLELYKQEAQGVNWQLLELITQLRKHYKVYLFTDTIDTHDEYNKTRGIYEKFDRVFKSFEIGVAKSQGKIAFEFILNQIHTKPEECFFIDDLERNTKVAEKVGIKAIVFKNLDDLKQKLKQYRIIV